MSTTERLLPRIFDSLVGRSDKNTESDDAIENSKLCDQTAVSSEQDFMKTRIAELNELNNRISSLRGLHRQEIEMKEALGERLQTIETQRIDALTAHRISGDESDKLKADELRAEAALLERNVKDNTSVAEVIFGKIKILEAQREEARGRYLNDLGRFFDHKMAQLVERYNQIVPDLTDVLTDIAALYEMMIRYRTGNSNGWWGQAHLPTIKPGDGKVYTPILDAQSNIFQQHVARRVEDLIAAFKEAGDMSPHN